MIKNYSFSTFNSYFCCNFFQLFSRRANFRKKLNNNIVESYYSELSSLPTISILSINDTQISRSENEGGIHGLTSDDLKYLSSLSQKNSSINREIRIECSIRSEYDLCMNRVY